METVFSEAADVSCDKKPSSELDVTTPVCIGEYEVLKDGEVRLGPHGKRWLDVPKLDIEKSGVSLIKECKDQIHHPPNASIGFPSLLQWILKTSSTRHSLQGEGINFVCYGSILECFASTPLKPEVDWQFIITKLYGVIFIGPAPSMAEKLGAKNQLDHMFLHYLSTSKCPEHEHQRSVEKPPEPPTMEEGLHCNVFIRNFNKFQVLYAVDAGCQGTDGRFVQCLLSEHSTPKPEEWWLPAYLCGSNKTIVGKLEGKDHVKEIRQFGVESVDAKTENATQHFLAHVLDVLTRATATTNEWAPFVFEYKASKRQFLLHTVPELLPQAFTSQFELFHFADIAPKS